MPSGPAMQLDLSSRPGDAVFAAEAELFGWGGLHGGVVLARLAAAMSGEVAATAGDGGERPLLRSVTGRFLRAVRRDAELSVGVEARGRTVGGGSAEVRHGDRVLVDASAIFGTAVAGAGSSGAASAGGAQLVPDAPVVPPPERCQPFELGDLAPPVGRFVEIRPADDRRPFTGGSTPELIAWLRVVDDEGPPDLGRLIFLADSLAPSWSAVLDEPALVPTIELTVRPTLGAEPADSPWVLVRTTASEMSADGWCRERIDLWGSGGAHLAAAEQLRLLLG